MYKMLIVLMLNLFIVTALNAAKITIVNDTITPGYDWDDARSDLNSNFDELYLFTSNNIIGTDTQAWDAFLDDIGALTDPGADRIMFWDDSGTLIDWLIIGSGLTITDKTISATGGGTGDVTAAAVITATAIVVGDDGAKGVKETNVLIDGSDNITGVASIDIAKVSGVAGLISVKEAETTSALYTGLMGPVDMTVAESYSIQFPNAQPAGSFLVAATPAGTGDPNGNKVAAGSWVLFPVSIGAAASDETTDLTTGESKVTFRAPFAFTLTEVRADVNTAPTGTGITVDIEEGGTTVLSTLITIDVSTLTSEDAATPPVISDSAIADNASITIDIDVIGSTIAGKGLKIWLIGTRPL